MNGLKPLLKKTVICVLCVFGLMTSIITAFVLHIAYDTRSTSVDFQEYAPTVLPAGVAIIGRSLEVWSEKASPVAHTKLLRFDLNTSRSSSLAEGKVKKSNLDNAACSSHSAVTNQTCAIVETPNHQQYFLVTTYQDTLAGKPFSQEAIWTRGDTSIMLYLAGSPMRTYPQDEWSGVVDSFVPVHYSKITSKHYSPGP